MSEQQHRTYSVVIIFKCVAAYLACLPTCPPTNLPTYLCRATNRKKELHIQDIFFLLTLFSFFLLFKSFLQASQ